MIRDLTTTNAKKFLIGVLIIGLGLLAASQASAQYGDLDCTDFGTRERAQYEFDQMDFDLHGLDRDRDGLVCEWNPSARFGPWVLGGMAVAVGTVMSMFRLDPENRVPWSQAFTHRRKPKYDKDWNVVGEGIEFDGNHTWELILRGWFGGLAVWLVAALARDRVLPRSTDPLTVLGVSVVVGALVGYGMNHAFETKRPR